MGPPPVPASRANRASTTTPVSGMRSTSSSMQTRAAGARSGSVGGSARASVRISTGHESGSTARNARGSRASLDSRVTSPPKSSDEEILSPQPLSPVRTRAAALEKLTSAGPSSSGAAASAAASTRKSTAATPPGPARTAASNTASSREIEDLKAKLRVLERKRLEDRDKIKQLDKFQADCEKYQGIIQKIQAKYQPQQQENNELRRQLKEAESRMESIETLQSEHDSAMELATLDREMAEETAEVYKAELDAVKLKNEELELEVEELRLENAEMTQGMTAEEKASAGWLQMERNNERLREALLRLRDITQQQEEELRDQIKTLEEDLGESNAVKEQYEKAKEKLAQSEAAVEDLRQQLDAAQAADDMIMDLTERNMSQAEQVEELKAVIEDLENLKEINDELEINHVQNEREMQEDIDFKSAVIQEQARRAAQQEETLEDMEYALSRFRGMVTGLQSDLEDMRASHAVTENESEQLNSKSRAMMDLNMKLQLSAAKAQVKTIDLELRRMEAQEAEQHLEIVKMFLPDAYLETDRNSVLALLRFRRLGFKAGLLGGFMRERVNQPAQAGHEDDVFAGCEVVDRLTWVAAMCERFVGAISRCSTEQFARFDGALYELEPVERALNGWIDGLRRDELKERTCAEELQRSMALMSHLAEVHISSREGQPSKNMGSDDVMDNGSGEDADDNGSNGRNSDSNNKNLASFADNVHMRAVLVQSHLESAAVALHTARGMVQRVLPPAGEEDEAAQHFARRAEMAIAQTRSAKVVASKAVRALEELKTRSLSLVPETLEAFEQCEAAARVLAELARQTGMDLHALLHEEGRADPVTYTEIQTAVHQAALTVSRAAAGAAATATAAATTLSVANMDEELFASYLTKLRLVASQTADLSALSGDLSQTVEFERSAAPWVVRSQEMKAPKAASVDAEEELRRLKEEHAEARRMIARSGNELGTAQLKIETLESKMRDAQQKATMIAELERAVAEEQVFTKQLKEDIEKQDRELKALETERDRWKKIASDASLMVADGMLEMDGMLEGEGGNGEGEGLLVAGGGRGAQLARSKERAAATAREMEALRSEIASLQAVVRYLREDNRRARLTEQHGCAWLAEPLKKKSRSPRAALVRAEAHGALGELVRLAASARIYDLGTLPADRLAWRPARTSPGYHAAKMAEDYAAWKDWQEEVVRKGREVTMGAGAGAGDGGAAAVAGSRMANRRQARKEASVRLQQTRLPETKREAKEAEGGVHIVGVGTQRWWREQVHGSA